MNSLLRATCVAWLALAAPAVLALGVGSLRVKSLQGAPLEAEIDLVASLDQMEQGWTVELLEDMTGGLALEPEVLASLGGTVQRASDGSLYVVVRSTEPVAGPEVSFRLRVASQQEAVIARMSGELLPLPKAPPMVQRPARSRPDLSSPGEAAPAAGGNQPLQSIAAVAPAGVEAAPVTPESVDPAPSTSEAAGVSSAVPDGTDTVVETNGGNADLEREVEAAPGDGDVEPAALPGVAAVGELEPAVEAGVPTESPESAPLQPASPATRPAAVPAGSTDTPKAPATAEEEPLPAMADVFNFSAMQALVIAGGLAVLVVLLVMRRRLANLVLARFPALRDETLKAQVASKIEALAARQAQVASTPPAAEPAPAARPEVDLNAEIDVLLAYAEYAKAEEKLQAALLESPNNVQAWLRLAELRYISEDSSGFVALVEEIQAHHRGELTDEQWQKLTRMGKVVAPDAALFAGPRVVHRDAS